MGRCVSDLPLNTSEKWGRELKRSGRSLIHPRLRLPPPPPTRPPPQADRQPAVAELFPRTRYLEHTGRLQQTRAQVLLHARARTALHLVLVIPGHGCARRPHDAGAPSSATGGRPDGREPRPRTGSGGSETSASTSGGSAIKTARLEHVRMRGGSV